MMRVLAAAFTASLLPLLGRRDAVMSYRECLPKSRSNENDALSMIREQLSNDDAARAADGGDGDGDGV